VTISLYDLFDQFSDAMAQQIKWNDNRKKRTELIMAFFDQYMSQKGFGGPCRDYMLIDAVWRDPLMGYITLALEHENKGDVNSFVDQEMAHLTDLKSINKVAITYPPSGEEKRTLEAIENVIKTRISVTATGLGEDYLIIFGFTTSQSGKRAVRWNGYFFDSNGKLRDNREKVVPQRG
jgi:hypothetical protein